VGIGRLDEAEELLAWFAANAAALERPSTLAAAGVAAGCSRRNAASSTPRWRSWAQRPL
jgi:hypothetical protein